MQEFYAMYFMQNLQNVFCGYLYVRCKVHHTLTKTGRVEVAQNNNLSKFLSS